MGMENKYSKMEISTLGIIDIINLMEWEVTSGLMGLHTKDNFLKG